MNPMKRDTSGMALRTALIEADAAVRLRITAIESESKDFWDFKTGGRCSYDESPFQYPAMMVPALQRELMNVILTTQPGIETIADPFVGSGTILCETMLAGKQFLGQDINPLAVLISQMRLHSLNAEELSEARIECVAAARADRRMDYDVAFFNQAKWFQKGVNIALSRLRRSILRQASLSSRMFLWIALAETIRQTSNSRTSTYKLHARPTGDTLFSAEDVFMSFESIAISNHERLTSFSNALRKQGFVANNRYVKKASIALGDSTQELPSIQGSGSQAFHFVMTSPPYGDNRTTVPYGQAGWLPLQWIGADDIAPNYRSDKLGCAYTIDGESIGGSRGKRDMVKMREELSDLSLSVKNTVANLAQYPKDGTMRFLAFVYDLHKSMQQIANRCADNAYLMWTLGHRKIRAVECPLTSIMSELFSHMGVQEVHRVHRRIHSKRMAIRNSIASTMREEIILILRRVPSLPISS